MTSVTAKVKNITKMVNLCSKVSTLIMNVMDTVKNTRTTGKFTLDIFIRDVSMKGTGLKDPKDRVH